MEFDERVFDFNICSLPPHATQIMGATPRRLPLDCRPRKPHHPGRNTPTERRLLIGLWEQVRLSSRSRTLTAWTAQAPPPPISRTCVRFQSKAVLWEELFEMRQKTSESAGQAIPQGCHNGVHTCCVVAVRRKTPRGNACLQLVRRGPAEQDESRGPLEGLANIKKRHTKCLDDGPVARQIAADGAASMSIPHPRLPSQNVPPRTDIGGASNARARSRTAACRPARAPPSSPHGDKKWRPRAAMRASRPPEASGPRWERATPPPRPTPCMGACPETQGRVCQSSPFDICVRCFSVGGKSRAERVSVPSPRRRRLAESESRALKTRNDPKASPTAIAIASALNCGVAEPSATLDAASIVGTEHISEKFMDKLRHRLRSTKWEHGRCLLTRPCAHPGFVCLSLAHFRAIGIGAWIPDCSNIGQTVEQLGQRTRLQHTPLSFLKSPNKESRPDLSLLKSLCGDLDLDHPLSVVVFYMRRLPWLGSMLVERSQDLVEANPILPSPLQKWPGTPRVPSNSISKSGEPRPNLVKPEPSLGKPQSQDLVATTQIWRAPTLN